MGFTNIKVYNGGIKDWCKNNYPIEAKDSLPTVSVDFVEAIPLAEKLAEYEKIGCTSEGGTERLMLLDLRDGNHVPGMKIPPAIHTGCRIQKVLLDDLLSEEVRAAIPHEGEVITITETGNRDEFAIRYLSQFGYHNIKGLKFGMRDWLKHRLPLDE